MKPGPFTRASNRGPHNLAGKFQRGFTMIEIMIVVAVMGLVAMIGVPAIYHAMHPAALQTAVNDVVEACGKARARAIWESGPVELRFQPQSGHYEVVSVPRDASPVDPNAPPVPGPTPEVAANPDAKPPGSISGQISDRVHIDMLDVNFRECKDAEEARVRFYPNGTCDELTLVLHSLDTGESKKISLELVTGLADVAPFP